MRTINTAKIKEADVVFQISLSLYVTVLSPQYNLYKHLGDGLPVGYYLSILYLVGRPREWHHSLDGILDYMHGERSVSNSIS